MSIFTRIKNALPEPGHFNARPARMIDEIYLNYGQSSIKKAWSFIKVRSIYLMFFLPMSVLDLAASAILGLAAAIATFLTSDSRQEYFLEQQKKYSVIFNKNARAIIFSLFGLISPKLIAFYFTPENRSAGVRAGGSYHASTDAELVKPTSEEELKDIIELAARENRKIMPKGAGFSQGGFKIQVQQC